LAVGRWQGNISQWPMVKSQKPKAKKTEVEINKKPDIQ
jgi:hypothetical protein